MGTYPRFLKRSVLLIPLFLVVALISLVAGLSEDAPTAGILGRGQIVFDWRKMACETRNYPDAPTRAFRDYRGRVQLIVSAPTNYRLIGPDLDHLSPSCHPVMSSGYDPHPSRYNDREWINTTYTRDGKRVYALIHDEYQGDEHPGRCPSGERERCRYIAITEADSTNGGRSFRQPRPPHQLIAAAPYQYVPDGGVFGSYTPSNIVHKDGYYYAMLSVRGYREQPDGTCLIRTRRLADPRSWRAWDGSGFGVTFIDPYRQRRTPLGAHVCRPVSREEIQVMGQSLTFSTYFNQYLLVGRSAVYSSGKRRLIPGVYFSLSRDLIHWSKRRLIMEAELVQTHSCGDPDPIGYPVVLDPTSRSRNFGTTGKRAYLYFTKFHYESCRPTPNRDLVRIPIEFSN